MAQLPLDASVDAVRAALEALPTVDGGVTVHRDGPLTGGFGLLRWRVTFRGNTGDLSLLAVDLTQLSGTAAHMAVSEVQAGSAHALTGDGPRLEQARKTAGLPYYVGTYTPQSVGAYQLVVRQLTKGGLGWAARAALGQPVALGRAERGARGRDGRLGLGARRRHAIRQRLRVRALGGQAFN
jgi:hypothetical protein